MSMFELDIVPVFWGQGQLEQNRQLFQMSA